MSFLFKTLPSSAVHTRTAHPSRTLTALVPQLDLLDVLVPVSSEVRWNLLCRPWDMLRCLRRVTQRWRPKRFSVCIDGQIGMLGKLVKSYRCTFFPWRILYNLDPVSCPFNPEISPKLSKEGTMIERQGESALGRDHAEVYFKYRPHNQCVFKSFLLLC